MKKLENYPSWLVPVGMAKSLKKAGFDLPCEFFLPLDNYNDFNIEELSFDFNKSNHNEEIGYLSIPTYEQVFEWFRDEAFKVENIKLDFKEINPLVISETKREKLIYKLIELRKTLIVVEPKKPTSIKKLAFQYFVMKLLEWFKEENKGKSVLNTLSITCVMKHLFLVCGVDKENHLFDIFDKFQAWTTTYVEADVYKDYTKCEGNFEFIGINRDSACVFDDLSILAELPEEVRIKIDNAFVKIKKKNKGLINYSNSRLSNLVKAHHSYDIYHNKVKRPYETVEKHLIINEPKYFV